MWVAGSDPPSGGGLNGEVIPQNSPLAAGLTWRVYAYTGNRAV